MKAANSVNSASLGHNCGALICSSSKSSSVPYDQSKRVWIWTESKQVMLTAVERGWDTFIFPSRRRELAHEWSCKLFLLFSLMFHCQTIKLVLVKGDIFLFSFWVLILVQEIYKGSLELNFCYTHFKNFGYLALIFVFW